MAKLILYDFRCTNCSAQFDDLVNSSVYESDCPECGAKGKRLVSTPRLDPKMGVDAEGNPTMADKWAKIRTKQAQIEKKHYEEHGTNMTPGADTAG